MLPGRSCESVQYDSRALAQDLGQVMGICYLATERATSYLQTASLRREIPVCMQSVAGDLSGDDCRFCSYCSATNFNPGETEQNNGRLA